MSVLVAYRRSSPAGRDALQLGARIANHIGTGLDIVSVSRFESAAAVALRGPEQGDEADPRTALHLAAELVKVDVPVHTHAVVDDSTASAILRTAHEVGASIIVLGTTSNGLFGRFSLGSVSNILLHSSDIPVALAPDTARDTPQDAPFGRVSVAIGDIGGNRTMFDTANLLAGADVPVRLLTLAAVSSGTDAERRTRTEAIARLDHLADLYRPERASTTTAQVEVASRITKAIDQVFWEPDEIVLIGSARIAREHTTFIGSTATKLLRALTVPMIVVPRDDQVPETKAAKA